MSCVPITDVHAMLSETVVHLHNHSGIDTVVLGRRLRHQLLPHAEREHMKVTNIQPSALRLLAWARGSDKW